MASLDDIRTEIERLTEARTGLTSSLSQGHDAKLVAQRQELDEQIAELWAAHRQERARLRFGERDKIIQRARAEERLERAA